VEVDGRRLRFRNALVATGGRAAAPEVPGLAEVGYRTNETLFDLTELPRRLVVVGAGPIGCEMAQAFARMGSQVTLLDRGERVLHREDPEAAAVVQAAMARDGVRLELGARPVEVVRGGRDGRDRIVRFERDAAPADGAGGGAQSPPPVPLRGEVAADEILVAAGRLPNVEGLGLEAAGVAYGPRGVQVDDYLRTTNPRVFASGDVAGSYQFTHFADAGSRLVLQNAFFAPLPFLLRKASSMVVPWCTFTSPEIAHVGLYEREARARGVALDTVTVPLHEVDRAVLDGEDEGFLRLHLAKGRDRILGATLVAEHAGDMLGELCLAITTGVGLGAIAATIHPYPTQGEVVKKAADAWRRGKLTPGVRRLFRGWFRLLR
jgi:pyruvate/2-oxoglutarate dehydrogenase complex dihydrolipoamide dehydrogenase (E3) component